MGNEAAPIVLAVDERRPRHPRRTRSLTFWAIAASAVVLAGVTSSLVAARFVAHDRAAASRLAFHNSSQDVAVGLQLAIQREQDLVVSAGAFMARSPNRSQAQFLAWSKSVRALTRYPELEGIGFVVIVPAARLPAFAARLNAAQPRCGHDDHEPNALELR